MAISSEVLIETPPQLRAQVQAAIRDVRIGAQPLVNALCFGRIGDNSCERLELGSELLELTQLTSSELRTLATTLHFSDVPEDEVTFFLDRLLDHHAMSVEVTVAMFHSHHRDLRDYAPSLFSPGDLGVSVAYATSGGRTVRTASAIEFVQHVLAAAPGGVVQQLAYLVGSDWGGSLWEAYEVAAAAQNADVTLAADAQLDWFDRLEK